MDAATLLNKRTMSNLITAQVLVTGAILVISLVEACVLHFRRSSHFDWWEAWLSVADMLGRRLIALLPLSLAAPVFAWAWQHRLFTMTLSPVASFLVLFICLEFFYYWYHRASHRIRFYWATHLVHHSPNQLTLSTAFRLGWTGTLTGIGLFFTPMVLIGFHPNVVISALSLNLLYQFWLHTTWIPKLGWLEYILNTPSSHRVHHASNQPYLDANYGGMLIIFDRLFGTYVAERDDEPCVYGLVHPIRTKNVFKLQFSGWMALWRDLQSARNILDALGYVFMPPEWQPGGVVQKREALQHKQRTE